MAGLVSLSLEEERMTWELRPQQWVLASAGGPVFRGGLWAGTQTSE